MWASLNSSCLGLCTSWTCVYFYFTRLRKFSVIISSNKFSIFCFSSLSHVVCLWCQLCYASCCFKGPLNYPYFFSSPSDMHTDFKEKGRERESKESKNYLKKECLKTFLTWWRKKIHKSRNCESSKQNEYKEAHTKTHHN